MLILSQDKKKTTENLELKIDDMLTEKFYIINKKYNTILGEYDTQERAKEVLKEIIEKYKEENYAMIESMAKAQLVYEMPEK